MAISKNRNDSSYSQKTLFFKLARGMALGLAMAVLLNISTSTTRIGTDFDINIHGAQRMNLNDFGDF